MRLRVLLLIFLLFAPGMTVNAQETTEATTEEWELVGYKIKYKTKTKTKKLYLGKFWITHYCPCSYCCGVGGGKITASGTRPTAGRTVGVNTNLIKYGTKLKVGKSKIKYVAEDTGGGIGWKHLDIFCNTHQEALNAGVGWEDVWMLKKVKYKVKKKIPVYRRMRNDSSAID